MIDVRVYYKDGFMIYKSGRSGPVFIAPHASYTLCPLCRGDVGTELITAELVKRLGGMAFVSTVPRIGDHGIDYFREPASLSEAHQMFKAKDNPDAMLKFEKKFAFFARDEEEYLEKITKYNEYWTNIRTLAKKKSLFVIVHGQGMRMKNFPSLLDIATLNGRWINEEAMKNVIQVVNKKYSNLFYDLNEDIKKYAIAWADIQLKNYIVMRFKEFANVRGATKHNLIRDIKRASELLRRRGVKLHSLSWNDYLSLIETTIDRTQFRVTYQCNFNGAKGKYAINRLLKHNGGEAFSMEFSVFMNEVYPNATVNIAEEIINGFMRKKKIDVFKSFILGHS